MSENKKDSKKAVEKGVKPVEKAVKDDAVNNALSTMDITNGPLKDEVQSVERDIKTIVDSKNPFTWITGLMKIKNSLVNGMYDIGSKLNKEFQQLDFQQSFGLLYKLGFETKNKENLSQYLVNTKFFDDKMFFEIYANINTDFKEFIQKFVSENYRKTDKYILVRNYKDKKKGLVQKYTRYKALINFLYTNVLLPKEFNIKTREIRFLHLISGELLKNKNRRELFKDFMNYFHLQEGDIERLSSKKMFRINKRLEDQINDAQENREIFKKKYSVIRAEIDNLVKDFELSYDYYIDVYEFFEKTFHEADLHQKYIFSMYIRSQIQNQYYGDKIKRTFLWYQIREKMEEQDWQKFRIDYRLRLDLKDPESSEIYKFLQNYYEFCKLINKIQDSFFSDLIKPFIYIFLTDNLNLDSKTFTYSKYILMFVLPRNYKEYCKIYNFIMEFERFKENKRFDRFKISLFLILMFVSLLVFIAYDISLILGIGVLLFFLGYYFKTRDYLDLKQGVRRHFGLQTIGLLIVMTYVFMILAKNDLLEIKIGIFNEESTYGKNITAVMNYQGKQVVKTIGESDYSTTMYTDILKKVKQK